VAQRQSEFPGSRFSQKSWRKQLARPVGVLEYPRPGLPPAAPCFTKCSSDLSTMKKLSLALLLLLPILCLAGCANDSIGSGAADAAGPVNSTQGFSSHEAMGSFAGMGR
jgi:hypothetical protein